MYKIMIPLELAPDVEHEPDRVYRHAQDTVLVYRLVVALGTVDRLAPGDARELDKVSALGRVCQLGTVLAQEL